jgi:hypothetical protein
MVLRAARLALWFVFLEALWTAVVGTAQHVELLAGLPAAAVGAAVAEVLHSFGLLSYRPDGRLLARSLWLPLELVFDFGLVTWVLVAALARGRRVRGSWVEAAFPTSRGARGRWQRAWAIAIGTATPNAIVVELAGERALLHAIAANAPTGRRVL